MNIADKSNQCNASFILKHLRSLSLTIRKQATRLKCLIVLFGCPYAIYVSQNFQISVSTRNLKASSHNVGLRLILSLGRRTTPFPKGREGRVIDPIYRIESVTRNDILVPAIRSRQPLTVLERSHGSLDPLEPANCGLRLDGVIFRNGQVHGKLKIRRRLVSARR